jgi:hypothetical protein
MGAPPFPLTPISLKVYSSQHIALFFRKEVVYAYWNSVSMIRIIGADEWNSMEAVPCRQQRNLKLTRGIV